MAASPKPMVPPLFSALAMRVFHLAFSAFTAQMGHQLVNLGQLDSAEM